MRPSLAPLDLALVGSYLLLALGLGAYFARRAGRDVDSFFVGDRKLPWWLAGTSMVATTFAADTPLAVTGIVATDGISGNWIWWCWAIAHLSATFFFARMWRRARVVTDAEITELRYGGRVAAVLRAVKAVYFGLFINCLTMAWVVAAMVKISRSFFDFEPGWVIGVCVGASVGYTLLGGLRSVVVTDLLQFTLGLGGALLLAVLLVARLGGLGAPAGDGEPGSGLLGELSVAVETAGDRSLEAVLEFVPPADHPTIPAIYFVVLLTIGWWRYAEGNGYLVQRMAACRDEGHAQGAMLWFAVAHNALRPWPWIVVGLASLVVFPRLAGPAAGELVVAEGPGQPAVVVRPATLDVATGGALVLEGLPAAPCRAALAEQEATVHRDAAGRAGATFGGFAASGTFDLVVECAATEAAPPLRLRLPGMRVELADREMAYPLLMGHTLPPGLLGLVVASLLAAFMSTIDTHTNWGASYLVQDLYRRFVRPAAPPRHYVAVSRACIALMGLLAGLTALFIQEIAAVWRFLLTLGAGLGSIGAARWFWPRVTAWAEIAALAVSTALAIGLELFCTPTLFGGPNPWFVFEVAAWSKILILAAGSLAAWVPVALLGPPNDPATLERFARRVRPPGPAWAPYRGAPADPLRDAGLRFAAGLVVVFGTLFGLGDLLLGRPFRGVLLLAVAVLLLARIIRSR